MKKESDPGKRKQNRNKIRIGVDARPLSTPLSGVGRVISMVLHRFPDPENYEFVLYSHRPWHEDFDSVVELPHVIWIQGRGWLASKGGLWFNLALPWVLRKARLDMFWGSQQIIPPLIPSRIPVVLTYYDLVLYLFPGAMRTIARWQQRVFQRYSVLRSSRILCISSQTRTDLIARFGLPPERASVSLLGYEKPAGASRGREALEGILPVEGPYILSVSTIEPRKNYATLLEGYYGYFQAEVENGNDPYPLVIVGRRGWETRSFYDRLKELQEVTQSIHVIEGSSDSQLYALYKNSAFFALASVYEGFGLPLLEALSAERFAVVSDIGSFREIGQNQVVYLQPKEPGIWALTLKETVDRHRSGSLPRVQFVQENWTWDHTARAHYDAFGEALEASD